MHKISVIVPVYNVERYLEKCIDSILKQTYTNLEVILIDDGSIDSSPKICDMYKKKDDRVRVIHKVNEGVSVARNMGLDIAQGDFIIFIDSDDYVHNQMIEILYKGIIENNSDISMCEYKNVLEDEVIKEEKYDEKLLRFENYTNIEALSNLKSDKMINYVVVWNKLYKRKLFDNLRYKEGKIHEDEFIIHKILYKCNRISYLHKQLYYYLKRNNSIMASKGNDAMLDCLDAQEERIKFYEAIGQKKLIKDAELMYVARFLDYYNRLRNSEKNDNQFIKKIIQRFRSRIFGLLVNNNFTIKERFLFVILCINPKIYDQYLKIKNGRVENGK